MNTLALKFLAPVILVGSSALIGCSHDAPPPVAANEPVGVTQTTSSIVSTTTTEPRAGMSVAPEIASACNIDFQAAAPAPKFDFDDSSLQDNDRAILDQVVTCVTTGPLKGRSLELTGRADPRGESEYNMDLGSQRASSVKSYLVQAGVSDAQISTTSRGALDATGTDESTWAIDRRVDITLK